MLRGVSAGSAVPVGLALEDCGQRSCRDRLAARTPAAGQHLEQHAAERPDVRALVDGQPARLFGTHVGGGAEDDALARAAAPSIVGDCEGRRAIASCRSSSLRQPEVEHLDDAVRRDLDVGRLEIAMDDAPLVRRFERVGDLPRDRQRLVRSGMAPRAIRSASVVALDEFEDERADAGGLFEAVESCAMFGMVERREQSRFALEAREAIGIAADSAAAGP